MGPGFSRQTSRTWQVGGALLAVAIFFGGIRHGWWPTPLAAQGGIRVTGTERLAWTQDAPSAAIAGSYRFIALVDGTPTSLAGVRCAPGSAGRYECEAPLPPMRAGARVVALQAMDTSGTSSATSAPLLLEVINGVLGVIDGVRRAVPRTGQPVPPEANPAARYVCTTRAPERRSFQVDVLAIGLNEPRSLMPLGDGRLAFLVAFSIVRIVGNGGTVQAYAPEARADLDVRVADLAIAPDFLQTGHLYMAIVRSRAGTSLTDIVRARELAGRIGEILTVVPDLPTIGGTDPALAVSSDDHLYVAMPSGRTPVKRRDVYEGRILRYESDGRAAVAAGWPVLSEGNASPSSIQVDAEGRAWLGSLYGRLDAPLRSLAVGRDSSRLGSGTSAPVMKFRNWPVTATGVRALAIVPGGDQRGARVYVAPSGLAGLLMTTTSTPDAELSFEQLPLGNVEPTALAAGPSGVLFVGGMQTGGEVTPRGILMRLTPVEGAAAQHPVSR